MVFFFKLNFNQDYFHSEFFNGQCIQSSGKLPESMHYYDKTFQVALVHVYIQVLVLLNIYQVKSHHHVVFISMFI